MDLRRSAHAQEMEQITANGNPVVMMPRGSYWALVPSLHHPGAYLHGLTTSYILRPKDMEGTALANPA